MRRVERPPRRLKLLPLIAATYFIVSGGPYGLEELLAKSGYERAIFVLLLIPLVWSFPTALMVGELSSALPEEGGYYSWVRRALGEFWGFQEAWLSLAASVFDMAIYPTMFVLYLRQAIPALNDGAIGYIAGASVIAACAWWNLRGAAAVGRAAVLAGAVMLAPFALLTVLGMSDSSSAAVGRGHTTLFGGIIVAMWNYTGWDNASTFAHEVERPQRSYPLAILATLALVTLGYLAPSFAVWRAGIDPSEWTTGGWVLAGARLGGRALAALIILGGMVSAVASFNSLILSYSHLPVRMADDGLLPRIFRRRHPRTQAPWVAIVSCSVAYACCLGLGFDRVVVVDMILYGLSLGLEFLALAVLRFREPALPRPFRVPGGRWGAVLLGIPPMALLAGAAVLSIKDPTTPSFSLGLSVVLALLGVLVYPAARRHAKKWGSQRVDVTSSAERSR